jgi:hypothetical protein
MHKRPVVLVCSLLLPQAPASPGSFAQEPQPASTQAPQAKPQEPLLKAEQPPLKQPLAFGLEDGTPVKLRLNRNLSSADAKTGDTVDFEVVGEVRVKDTVIIPQGGIAWATVTNAEPKRRMGRGGKLDVNIDNVRLADGERAPLRAVKDLKGGSNTGKMTAAMVGTAIVFFPAAPLFLFVKGKDITIPKDTEITAYVNGDITLNPARFQPDVLAAAAAAPTPQSATPAEAGLASIELKSDPNGADITVDGKYMGNTPSTLKLAPGDHMMKVAKSGFKTWEKILTVSGGASVTLAPILEKEQEHPDNSAQKNE